jgi:4-hydroxybenzoate polyprenyltransferase
MIRRVPELFLRMLRLRVAVTMWTFLVIGLARHATPALSLDLVLASLALAASYVTATTLNDIADRDIDAINRPRDRGRPLVTGEATVPQLWATHAAAVGVAFAAAVPLGPVGIGVVGSSLLASWAYSAGPIRASRRMFAAPVVLSFAYVAIPYLLGVVIAGGRVDPVDVVLIAGLYVLFFARIILKDFRDRLGDAVYGKPTMLLRLGKSTTCTISICGVLVGIAILAIGSGVPPAISALFALYAAGIVWMLARLRATDDPKLEQVAIGLGARLGNGVLISLLAWLLLSAEGADTGTVILFETCLGLVYAASFLGPVRHPETVRIAYKA